MVLRVEFDGLGEQADGGIVILGLEGFVSLIFEFVCLRNLISDPPSKGPGGQRGVRLTWLSNRKVILGIETPVLISLPGIGGIFENLRM